MRYAFALLTAIAFGVAMTGVSLAEETYGEKAANELATGLQEAVAGSLEVPKEMYETAKRNPAEAVTLAPIRGAKQTAERTSEGSIKAGTFALPPHGEERYAEEDSFDKRFTQGLKETAEGSVQVPVEMAESAKKRNPAETLVVAPLKGAKETALRTTEGAIKTGTFLIPKESASTSHTQ